MYINEHDSFGCISDRRVELCRCIQICNSNFNTIFRFYKRIFIFLRIFYPWRVRMRGYRILDWDMLYAITIFTRRKCSIVFSNNYTFLLVKVVEFIAHAVLPNYCRLWYRCSSCQRRLVLLSFWCKSLLDGISVVLITFSFYSWIICSSANLPTFQKMDFFFFLLCDH